MWIVVVLFLNIYIYIYTHTFNIIHNDINYTFIYYVYTNFDCYLFNSPIASPWTRRQPRKKRRSGKGNKDVLLCEPRPCDSLGETAIQPLLCCSGSIFSRAFLSGGEFFTDTGITWLPAGLQPADLPPFSGKSETECSAKESLMTFQARLPPFSSASPVNSRDLPFQNMFSPLRNTQLSVPMHKYT